MGGVVLKVKQNVLKKTDLKGRGSFSSVRWYNYGGKPTKPSAHCMHNESDAGGRTDSPNPPGGLMSSGIKR